MYTLRVPRGILTKAAKILSKYIQAGDVIGLVGPLGVGKTTFVKHLGKLLQVKQKITSPTFTVLQDYSGKLNNTPLTLYHADFYRVDSEAETKTLGLEEIFSQPNSIFFIEWADKFPKILPTRAVMIILEDK